MNAPSNSSHINLMWSFYFVQMCVWKEGAQHNQTGDERTGGWGSGLDRNPHQTKQENRTSHQTESKLSQGGLALPGTHVEYISLYVIRSIDPFMYLFENDFPVPQFSFSYFFIQKMV